MIWLGVAGQWWKVEVSRTCLSHHCFEICRNRSNIHLWSTVHQTHKCGLKGHFTNWRNSWKRDCPCSVVLHARRTVKGKFLVATVDKKCLFDKEKTTQLKLVVSCAYRANSEFNRVCAPEPVSGREDLIMSNLTGQFDRVVCPPPSNTISLESRP